VSADFVSLADVLRAAAVAPPAPGVADPERDAAALATVPEPPSAAPDDVYTAVRDARLFRARLADAFDAASARLIRELAAEVLARELRLAPCDLESLLRRVRERVPVVRVRVAPADLAHVRAAPCVADPGLAAGDAVLELDGGTLDARLGVRLATVLDGFA
jgi:hypothetical protein